MAQIFPQWTNRIPPLLVVGLLVKVVVIILIIWYYFSPRYTDAGYRPVQPVPYSHKLHAGDLGLDCRFCHTTVETSSVSMVPPTQTCMNCHTLILPESEKLLPVRGSWATQQPIRWVRVHNLPDFAYFDHSAHMRAGVGCISCHGNVAEMEEVMQMEPLSMGWCLSCHRDPEPNLRPTSEVTNMQWEPSPNHEAFAARMMTEKNITPPVDCSGCHR